jgi:hypothetical protein
LLGRELTEEELDMISGINKKKNKKKRKKNQKKKMHFHKKNFAASKEYTYINELDFSLGDIIIR